MKMNVGEICGILASIVSIVGIAMNEIPIATGLVSLLLGLGIFGIAHEAVQKK
jgi:predicted membrane channel-forming protein YqfA (hemolysin III family)